MKILYIFPHPDDESFGPAGAMNAQLREGHEVYLLTLTKGGATKQRHKLGLTIEQMGEVRYKEMLAMANVLGLTRMDVWDYPDGGLKEMDPRVIEQDLINYINDLQPNIIVSYPVHGISGFHDHLVAHAVIKRLYLEMKEAGAEFLKRLAFFTLPDNGKSVFQAEGFRIKQSEEELIDCVQQLNDDDVEMIKHCLYCYETYQETIKESDVINRIGDKMYFEIYGESFKPVLQKITEQL